MRRSTRRCVTLAKPVPRAPASADRTLTHLIPADLLAVVAAFLPVEDLARCRRWCCGSQAAAFLGGPALAKLWRAHWTRCVLVGKAAFHAGEPDRQRVGHHHAATRALAAHFDRRSKLTKRVSTGSGLRQQYVMQGGPIAGCNATTQAYWARCRALVCDHGASVDLADEARQSVLHYACNFADAEMIAHCVGAGADMTCVDKKGVDPASRFGGDDEGFAAARAAWGSCAEALAMTDDAIHEAWRPAGKGTAHIHFASQFIAPIVGGSKRATTRLGPLLGHPKDTDVLSGVDGLGVGSVCVASASTESVEASAVQRRLLGGAGEAGGAGGAGGVGGAGEGKEDTSGTDIEAQCVPFALLLITGIREARLCDVDDELAELEGMSSGEELRAVLRHFYPLVEDEDTICVYRFAMVRSFV